tara:strand:- start:1655 stop:2149 length:495 start_codon:yes stop_codon:yes gene_type:complete
MKTRTTLLALVLTSSAGFSQISSYVSSLQTSEAGITVAELSIVHRSRSNSKDIRDLGSRSVMISKEIYTPNLKIESYRFLSYAGSPFEINGSTYIPVSLYYDNETTDPKDDIYIVSIPFTVERELVLDELSYYEGEELIGASFEPAPQGRPNKEAKKVNVIRSE